MNSRHYFGNEDEVQEALKQLSNGAYDIPKTLYIVKGSDAQRLVPHLLPADYNNYVWLKEPEEYISYQPLLIIDDGSSSWCREVLNELKKDDN